MRLHAADEAAARLGKETGHPERIAALAVDIADSKSIEAAAQTLQRDYAGKLGGLINNAAVRFQGLHVIFIAFSRVPHLLTLHNIISCVLCLHKGV